MIYLTRLKEHEALHGYFASSVNDPLHFRDHVTFNQLDEARQTKSIGQFDKRDTGQGLQRRNSIRVQIVKQLAEGGLTHAWHLHLCVCTYTRRGQRTETLGEQSVIQIIENATYHFGWTFAEIPGKHGFHDVATSHQKRPVSRATAVIQQEVHVSIEPLD